MGWATPSPIHSNLLRSPLGEFGQTGRQMASSSGFISLYLTVFYLTWGLRIGPRRVLHSLLDLSLLVGFGPPSYWRSDWSSGFEILPLCGALVQ